MFKWCIRKDYDVNTPSSRDIFLLLSRAHKVEELSFWANSQLEKFIVIKLELILL